MFGNGPHCFVARCLEAGLAASVLLARFADARESPSSPAAGVSQTLGEVIVTAQRREENLQRVPIAVTAVPSEELERRQILSLAGRAVCGAQSGHFSDFREFDYLDDQHAWSNGIRHRAHVRPGGRPLPRWGLHRSGERSQPRSRGYGSCRGTARTSRDAFRSQYHWRRDQPDSEQTDARPRGFAASRSGKLLARRARPACSTFRSGFRTAPCASRPVMSSTVAMATLCFSGRISAMTTRISCGPSCASFPSRDGRRTCPSTSQVCTETVSS